ncbi:MAG: hypothetical protein ACRD2D_11085 [Terriglobales bacterium]
MNKLPFDGSVTMRLAAKHFSDEARVRQFYDPRDRVGRAIAAQLGKPGRSAWDIYLFYPPGARWQAAPPPPLRWMHQLGWLDPAHHHSGADLSRHLERAAQADLAVAAGAAPPAR